MERAESIWRPLGELLVEKKLLTEEELELALTEQAETGRLLGAILVERGYVSGPALAVALAEQDNVVKLEAVPAPVVEIVRDPEPDPELDRLEAENRRLQDEIERLRGEFTKLKLVETPVPATSHLLFVPTPARYLLVEREGAPPQPGAKLELDQGAFAVAKLGDAPFPGEERPCAFLLPLG
jgi:hypothetical protein